MSEISLWNISLEYTRQYHTSLSSISLELRGCHACIYNDISLNSSMSSCEDYAVKGC